MASLTHLTQKKNPWYWSEDCQKSFKALKKAFTTAPILAKRDPDSKLIVETDASDRALAAILSTHVGKEIHPIAFHSRIFNNAELNYDIHDKELLAIFEAFKKWRHYLEEMPSLVEVFTNHKNLIYFCDSKALS